MPVIDVIIKDSAVLAEAAGAVPGVNHRSLAALGSLDV
jgi:hypothetical protein